MLEAIMIRVEIKFIVVIAETNKGWNKSTDVETDIA